MSMRQLAKDIIVEIIRHSGGILEGKTRLYKAFYFAHLFYFEASNGLILSDWPIVHMPQGPGIDCGDHLLAELEEDGAIAVEKVPCGPYSQECYRLSGGSHPDLDHVSTGAIKRACEFIEGKSAQDLSSLTHERSRAYCDAASGDELNIYRDTLDDGEFGEQERQLLDAKAAIKKALDHT